MPARRPQPWIRGRTARCRFLTLGLLMLLGASGAAAAAEEPPRTWGLGWDDGLTVRRWLGAWELALAAGPDDQLVQEARTSWHTSAPPDYQGLVEVPRDDRRESGFVRGQVGRRVLRAGPLTAVAFAGLAYNWIDRQERSLLLDPVSGGYDELEVNGFTHRWWWEIGLRPAWQPWRRLSLEFSYGLRYTWENWDETWVRQRPGQTTPDRDELDGEASRFSDFGWEGLASLAFIIWL